MRILLKISLVTAWMLIGRDAGAQPQIPAGSRLSAQDNNCAICHGESDLWEGDKRRLFVPSQELMEDVHWKAGVNCHDCHGGDPGNFSIPEAHAAEGADGQSEAEQFRPELSQPTRTQARLSTQTEVCGKCHAESLQSYMASVHGHGFKESGLVVTAACTDCHGSHGIYPASDVRSKLHTATASATCATCHRFIEEQLDRSVHGHTEAVPVAGGAPAASGEPAVEPTAAPNDSRAKPVCTDCHQGHDLPHPRSARFRLTMPDRCGNCHAELQSSFSLSLHGKLTDLGYLPGARCSDCHGSHDILPASNPDSRLSSANRRNTCAQCHSGVTDKFLEFDPHADASNARRDPILYWVNVGLTWLLIGVFTAFGLHTLLWMVRSWMHVRKHGRPERLTPGKVGYVRFQPVHRAAHTVLMISFLGLALTGLPLKYSHYPWAQAVSSALGGFATTGLWHRIFGVANVACLVFYCLWFGSQLVLGPWNGMTRSRFVFGPDSPVPNGRDVRDVGRMLRWFVGLGPKPTFERWTYWEKFDIWAACSDIILIGSTGIILWFPTQFCALLPGETLNLASVIHGKLALLATGFIFTIHFLNTHLRAEKFPMDTSILTGLVSVEELEDERPELAARMRASGQFEQLLEPTPPRRVLWLITLGGAIALAIGIALLVGILTAVFS
jgi:cytochrome b subunit of formate dehydrogenase